MTEIRIADYSIGVLESTPLVGTNAIYIADYTVSILHKFNTPVKITLNTHYFYGDVTLEGTPKEAIIYAYDSESFSLVVQCISNNQSGVFTLPITTSGTCFIVSLSDNSDYNHIVAKSVVPTPII